MSKETKNHLELLKLEDTLTLKVDWASEEQKKKIIELNLQEGRQTMNLRLMKTAKLIVVKDPGANDEIVGWTGFDLEHNPKYPELFSLYLGPKYREASDVGLALSHIKYVYLMSLGYKKVFGRVQMDKNNERLDFRIKLGINELVNPEEHKDWASYCQKCELYKKTCNEQAYFIINLEKLARMARIKLGDPVPPFVPGILEIRLEKEDVKGSIIGGKFSVKWAA